MTSVGENEEKANTIQPPLLVFFLISWKIIRLALTVFPSFVIILLLFVCQRIWFYIQELSILTSNNTLLEIMFKKEFWIYNSLILNISGLIYSLNLLCDCRESKSTNWEVIPQRMKIKQKRFMWFQPPPREMFDAIK